MSNSSERTPIEEDILGECTISDHELLALRQDEVQRDHLGIINQGSVMVTGSKSLAEALFYSTASGLKITSLQARDCGIAFLATDINILPSLQLSIQHVRSLSFHSNLVSNDTFVWDGGKLALPCLEYRQQELYRAITSGLLGLFILAAEDIEELNIDL